MDADVTIVTFRDIFQDEAGKKGRYTDEYRDLSARIILDRQEMARLGVKDGQRLKVQNDVGSVVVAAKASEDEPHPALAFMISSPWSNQLVGDEVCNASNPGPKRITARVSPTDDGITQISELLQRMRA
ncbi:MAG: molybdopterin dinucleotide binding domain protein [Methanosaeta sp. PtaU1.Bin060]|jgi:formylmethanofuran dehydrogenase subunit D|nr:MAG: molybdopterin dinucleotide binding domain protein [Methanosaeta sp. PtaU1.Bin060]